MDAPTDDADRRRPSKLAIRLIIGLLLCMVAANIIGDLLTTSLARDHPLVLIALNSRNRVLVLTTNQLDALSYYGVASVRLLIPDPLFFLLGMWYGDAAIRWVERKWASQGQVMRWFEGAFAKASYPLVFLAPNNFICLFAGASGMAIPVFLLLNVSGTMARLFAIRVLGATFESPIAGVLDFFKDYRLPLLGLSIVLVVTSLVLDRRSGRGEIDAIKELEDELEDDR